MAIPPDTLPVTKPKDTYWLWAVGILALLSPVCFWVTFQVGFEPEALLMPIITLPETLVCLRILWRLRAKTRKQGLALAVAVGSVSFLVGVLTLWGMATLSCRRGPWGAASGGLFAISQLALITCAIKAYLAQKPQGDEKPTFGAEIFRRALFVGIPLLVFEVIPVPNLIRSRSVGDGLSPVSILRSINTAEITYSSTYSSSFSSNLAVLGSPTQGSEPSASAAGLTPIDEWLAWCARSGYKIDYKPGPIESGRIATYSVTVRPIKYGCPNADLNETSYYSDQSGVIRQTNEDRPATAKDPPIGG